MKTNFSDIPNEKERKGWYIKVYCCYYYFIFIQVPMAVLFSSNFLTKIYIYIYIFVKMGKIFLLTAIYSGIRFLTLLAISTGRNSLVQGSRTFLNTLPPLISGLQVPYFVSLVPFYGGTEFVVLLSIFRYHTQPIHKAHQNYRLI